MQKTTTKNKNKNNWLPVTWKRAASRGVNLGEIRCKILELLGRLFA